MLQALGAACNGNWGLLPVEHNHGWRFLIRYLRGAGCGIEADLLLADYAWIKAKLAQWSFLPATCQNPRTEPSFAGRITTGR
jgi:hypothetical protein